MTDDTLTLAEAAAALGVSRDGIYSAVRRLTLRRRADGLFDREAVERYRTAVQATAVERRKQGLGSTVPRQWFAHDN